MYPNSDLEEELINSLIIIASNYRGRNKEVKKVCIDTLFTIANALRDIEATEKKPAVKITVVSNEKGFLESLGIESF